MKVTVDIVLFKIIDKKLCILLTQRAKEPFIHAWCLPGGFINDDERVEDAAIRVLHKETGLRSMIMEQFHMFSDPKRDPRGRTVSVGFLGIITTKQVIKVGATQSNVVWMPIDRLEHLAFDHEEVRQNAFQVLQRKVQIDGYANHFLPQICTIRDLQEIYEIVLHRTFDKRNFRRTINKWYSLKKTGKKEYGKNHRPAELYIVKSRN